MGDLIFGWTRLHGLAVGRESRADRFGQGDLEHLVHRVHHVQLERIEDGLGNVRQILLIVLRQDDRLQTRAVRRQHLLLDAADREHLAA